MLTSAVAGDGGACWDTVSNERAEAMEKERVAGAA